MGSLLDGSESLIPVREPNMNPAALILDLGNVMLQQRGPSPLQEWASRFGLGEKHLLKVLQESMESHLAFEGTITEEQFWDVMAKRFNLTPDSSRNFRDAYYSGEELEPLLLGLIQQLRPKCTVAVLSNAWSDARRRFERLYELDSFFDLVIYSAEIGVSKPDLRAYEIAASLLQISTAKIVFVDNKLENVLAAKRAGMLGIVFREASQATKEIRTMFHQSLPSSG